MEQQKLLWIIFALATGVLVVVAAAFILFVPPGTPAETVPRTAAVDNENFDVTAFLKSDEETMGLEAEPADGGDTSFVIGVVEDSEGAARNNQAAVEENPSSAVVKAPAPAPLPAPVQAPVKPAPAPVKKVWVTEYWIQAGSFSHRSSAEEAKASLHDKEFDSVISTKDVNGTQYFRVRIGPYKYKAEAEKFLGYIKNISSFEGSQIYEKYVEKTL